MSEQNNYHVAFSVASKFSTEGKFFCKFSFSFVSCCVSIAVIILEGIALVCLCTPIKQRKIFNQS